jgi:hypothetical protein
MDGGREDSSPLMVGVVSTDFRPSRGADQNDIRVRIEQGRKPFAEFQNPLFRLDETVFAVQSDQGRVVFAELDFGQELLTIHGFPP